MHNNDGTGTKIESFFILVQMSIRNFLKNVSQPMLASENNRIYVVEYQEVV